MIQYCNYCLLTSGLIFLSLVQPLFFRSQDDPSVLYAAMSSGLGCAFLSGDLMRDHRFKLALQHEELRKTFLKWQRTHQMELMKVHADNTVSIKVSNSFRNCRVFFESAPLGQGEFSCASMNNLIFCLGKQVKRWDLICAARDASRKSLEVRSGA